MVVDSSLVVETMALHESVLETSEALERVNAFNGCNAATDGLNADVVEEAFEGLPAVIDTLILELLQPPEEHAVGCSGDDSTTACTMCSFNFFKSSKNDADSTQKHRAYDMTTEEYFKAMLHDELLMAKFKEYCVCAFL